MQYRIFIEVPEPPSNTIIVSEVPDDEQRRNADAKEPAKKYWDETAHRTVDHSHRDSEHEHYAQQRSRVERAVGVYRFYVYGGGAFDAMTTDLLRGREHTVDDLYVLAEDKVELWTHRALLNDSRLTDPNTRSDAGSTALHCAARSGDATSVSALAASPRVDPNLQDRQGHT